MLNSNQFFAANGLKRIKTLVSFPDYQRLLSFGIHSNARVSCLHLELQFAVLNGR